MKSLYRWALTATVVILLVSGTVRAEDQSLKMVPSTAPIVVQLNGFDKARGNLGKFLGNALPDKAPQLVQQIDDAIKQVSEGRDLKAIVKDARIYVIIPDLAAIGGEGFPLAVMIPVTSYADFKKGLLKEDERKSVKKDDDGFESVTFAGKDDPMFMVDRKNYVVVTNDKGVAKKFAKGEATGLDKAISKETAKAFLEQDVALYINLEEINKQFGAKIKAFKLFVGPLLQQGGMVDKKQAEQLLQLFDAVVSLLEDGVAAVIGAEFRPEGFNFKFTAQFNEKSDTNAFLKKLKPAGLSEIGMLPTGRVLYTASNFNPMLSKTLSAMMKESTIDDENDEAKSAIAEAQKELADNAHVYEISATDLPGGSLKVTEFKDAAKALASQMKMFKALTKTGSYGNVPLKSKPEIKDDAESVGDIKLTMVKLSPDYDKAVEKLPEAAREAAKSAMIKIAGEQTMIWVGRSGNKVIQVSGKDWKDAKALIDGYLKGKDLLAQDEAFAAMRKQLPAEASMIVAGDAARTLAFFFDLIKDQLGALPAGAVPGLPGQLPDLKAPKGKHVYFGVATVLKSEFVEFDLFVPVTVVQQLRKMFASADADN